jgi:hypothetical protein
MARKPEDRAAADPRAAIEVRSVSLSAIDWQFLKGLGDELHARGLARATTSAAIRSLLEQERKRKDALGPGGPRVDGTKRPDGTVEYAAYFEVGAGAEAGQILVRVLDLQTGEVQHLIRSQRGPIRVDVPTSKPKRKRR